MDPREDKVVRMAGLGAAAIAAVLSPVPLADEVVLFPALLGLGAVVGRQRGLALRDMPWRAMTTTATTALASRAVANLAVSYVPGVAAVANAATAFALTRLYAAWAAAACADPERARPPSYEELLEVLRKSVPRRATSP